MNIASIVAHYVAIILIFRFCYLLIELLELYFKKVEEKDEKAKPRKKIGLNPKWQFWRTKKKYYTFVLTFVHKIITVVLALILSILFIIFLIFDKKSLIIYLLLSSYCYYFYNLLVFIITKIVIWRTTKINPFNERPY